MKRLWMVGALALALGTATAQGQTRQISGTVVEEGSGAPLSAAQVHVKGTAIGTSTRANGTFTLQVPARDVVLEVRSIGYTPIEVTVLAQTATVTVTMKRDALKLNQVVVTGQASEVSRRNLANSVASVSAEDLTKVSTQSIDDAFQGKIAGATLSTSTGAPGGGTRLQIRGISSILGSAQPLFVVDGVIVTDIAIGSGTNKITAASGTVISYEAEEAPDNRIGDINPNDIESVEVLKGSAASAIYGSKASGGVILITTKRGQSGSPRFNLQTGMGTSVLAYRNGSRHFQSLADAVTAFGPNITPYWNPNLNLDYENLAYGNRPVNQETSLSVRGGTENTKYFVSGLYRDEQGIVNNTFARKYELRVNIDQKLSDRLELLVGSAVARTGNDRGLFGNDNRGNSVAYTLTATPGFLDLRQNADGTWPINPIYPSNPLQTIAQLQNREWVWRFINTARLTFDAIQNNRHHLRVIAYGGADALNQNNNVYSPPSLQYETANATYGTSIVSWSGNLQSNLNLNLVDSWTPRSWVTATSQVGTQFEDRVFAQTRTSGQNLLGGLEEVTAGTIQGIAETRLRTDDFGVFAQTEVLFWEKLMATVGVRADRSSNNGDPGKFFFFPKASASYRLGVVRRGWLDDLKLRVAYGETGNQPLYGQKFTPLTNSNISGIGALQVSTTLAAAGIRPERQAEFEGGLDMTILGNKGTLELTGYVRNVSDMLITQTLAPSTGYGSETSNGAGMQVRGAEVVASIFAVNRGEFSWTTRLNWGANRSKITYLPVPSFLLGSPQSGAVKIELGKSATQIWANDTLPQPGGRVVVPRVIGDGNPLWNAGWGNEFRYGSFSFYALLDRQLGGMSANGTWRHYDLSQNSIDYDQLNAAGLKIGDVRRTTYLQVTNIFYEDASYLKLREATVGWDIPPRVVHRVFTGASTAKLTLSGRNLIWWTNYRGGDPESQNFGNAGIPASVQRNVELAAYPASKTFWLTLSVDF